MVMLLQDETAEGILLEVEESARALDVREGTGLLGGKKTIPAAADETVIEIANQFLVMVLADPEEIDDFKIQIIENFDLGGFLVEEHLGAAGKGFDVGLVLGKESDDLGGKPVLAPDVGEGSDH